MAKPKCYLIPITDFYHKPGQIRKELGKGNDYIIAKNNKLFAWLCPVKEGERVKGEILGLSEIRENRMDFVYTLMGGGSFTLTYHNKPVGYITPRIPVDAVKRIVHK